MRCALSDLSQANLAQMGHSHSAKLALNYITLKYSQIYRKPRHEFCPRFAFGPQHFVG